MFSRKREAACDFNMTPMIDCTFQLLIFFLLGARFSLPDARFDTYLPRRGAPPPRPDLEAEDVRISMRCRAAGEPDVLIELGEQRARGAKLLLEREGFLKRLRAERPDVGVVIAAEGAVKFDWIVKALNAASRAGYERISFAAPPLGLRVGADHPP